MRVLVIDNYDSFVYILAQMVGASGAEVLVYRNDAIGIDACGRIDPDRIILSPGPGAPSNPRDFGVCSDILASLSREIPTLGVCLGHQGIIHHFGGRVVRASRIMHGKTSLISHNGEGIFKGVENPFSATRYHSLVGERGSIPPCLTVTAHSLDDGEVMGVHHTEYPIVGVQFHPESILTEVGGKVLQNFLEGAL